MNRSVLIVAAVAVALAAADTYVVVMALPDMMTSVGKAITELQEAAPILSTFLLGYVGMLPLIGNLTDRLGRTPMLVAGLLVFAGGSLVTAMTGSLVFLLAGRFLQGLGGGALLPATLALIADAYPAERRGVPLGWVTAIQEVGSIAGPIVGAVLIALASWRAIFWVNLAAALLLAVLLWWLRPSAHHDAPRPGDATMRLDVLSAVLLAIALGGVVLAFATADPREALINSGGAAALTVSVLAVVVLVVREMRTRSSLFRSLALPARGWGAIALSFVLGALVVSAVVGVPMFVLTADSEAGEVHGAAWLLRFLVAVPVGALIGGYLDRKVTSWVLVSSGMALMGLGFLGMSRWTEHSLTSSWATVVLLAAGLGAGLTTPPLTNALLSSVRDRFHGFASSLLVAARMVGMLVGLSAITSIGLWYYYGTTADMPTIADVCGDQGICQAYEDVLIGNALNQETSMFSATVAIAIVGVVLARPLLGGRRRTETQVEERHA